MASIDAFALPLAGVTVIEIPDGKTDMCGRFLADLGADVIMVEPPAGAASRHLAPIIEGTSLYFATHAANKRSVVCDLDAETGRSRFRQLLAAADIFIDTTPLSLRKHRRLDAEALHAINPSLIILSITDFGLTGPWRDYVGTDAVHIALSGTLCRSGQPGFEPLLPPGSFALESAAMQAAWCALLGFWQRLHTGFGDLLDMSIYEAATQMLDPPLGMSGSAWGGQSALEASARDRPAPWPFYPIFRCVDGHVRIGTPNPRQWIAMSEWLGPDHPFTDPGFAVLAKRKEVIHDINHLIGAKFASLSASEILAEAQRRGVPAALVSKPADVLRNEHFLARGALMPFSPAKGLDGIVPSGFVEIDGMRAGIRSVAPALGVGTKAAAQTAPRTHVSAKLGGARRPLGGVRILDFGIIVAGAELGRILADQGAEVIKIETRAFPDGVRQDFKGRAINPSFALGSRNKESLGLNLKSAAGRDIFKRLVAQADVVLSNFKPGTLESLGIGHDVLNAINPRIVMLDSSALGRTGPLSRSMGYGPLVRATAGMTYLWRYSDSDEGFSDGVTVYPDHHASRVAATAVMALLIRREQTGKGGTASVSQAETFLASFSDRFLDESLEPGSFKVRGNTPENDAPNGVFRCQGDDDWCVVSVRNTEDWMRLAKLIGRDDLAANPALSTPAGRLHQHRNLHDVVAGWTRRYPPREAMARLQGAGVPAGFMQRLGELHDDPQLRARNFFRVLNQAGLDEPLTTENGPMTARAIPDPDIRSAPFQGEHTRSIVARLLGLSGDQIDRLIASGDLEEMLPKRSPTPEPVSAA